jgi:transcriptional regulator with XRE-family HTH domain
MFKKKMLKELLEKAVDEYPTATEFSEKSGVDRTYLSKLMNLRKDKPPKPETLKDVAKVSNSVSYIELMVACGYLEDKFLSYLEKENKKEKKREQKDLIGLYIKQNKPEYYSIYKKMKDDPYRDEIVFVYEFNDEKVWNKEDDYNLNSHEYCYFPKKYVEKTDLAIKIKDNRFEKLGFAEGDLLLVKIIEYIPDSGTTVLLAIKKDGNLVNKMIRRIYRLKNGKIRLEPDNNYNSIYDESEIMIIGKIYSMKRNFENKYNLIGGE